MTSAPSAVDHASPSDAPARAVSLAPAPTRHDVAESAQRVAPKTSHRAETSDTHAPTMPAVDSETPDNVPTPSSRPSPVPPIVAKRMDAAPIAAISASAPARSSDDRTPVIAAEHFVAMKTAHREETSETHAQMTPTVAAAKPERAQAPSARPSSVAPIATKHMDSAPLAVPSSSDAARAVDDRPLVVAATVADTTPVRSTDAPAARSAVTAAHDAPRATLRDAASLVTPPKVAAPATSPAHGLDASDSALLSTIDAFAAARAAQTSRGDRKTPAQKSEPATSGVSKARSESDEAETVASAPLERGVAPSPPIAEAKRAGDAPAHSSTIAAAIRDAATPAVAQAAAAIAEADLERARFERASKEEEIAAPTIGRIDLSTPSANPAPAMVALLAPQARALIATGRAAVADSTGAATRPAEAAQRAASLAAKTLTIELAPESLGAVVVKMKIAHSGVDMKISVRSEEALHKLEATRSALVDAMQSAGCSIDGCTIQIAAAPTPDAQRAATEGGGFFASSNGAETQRGERNVGGEGTSDGQGSGERRRDTGPRDDGAPDTAPRRPADRRGGGVYL